MALAESSVDPLRQEKAQEYGRLSRRLSLIELAIVGVLLLGILFGGASIELGKFLTASQPWAAAVYLVILAVGCGVVTTPLTNAYNRHVELRADGVALWLTDNPEAFVSVMIRLTDQNLTEAQPSRWVKLLFYDHPPYTKWVSLAYNYQKEAH